MAVLFRKTRFERILLTHEVIEWDPQNSETTVYKKAYGLMYLRVPAGVIHYLLNPFTYGAQFKSRRDEEHAWHEGAFWSIRQMPTLSPFARPWTISDVPFAGVRPLPVTPLSFLCLRVCIIAIGSVTVAAPSSMPVVIRVVLAP